MLTILDTSDDHHVLKACTMSSTKGLFPLGCCDQSYTQRDLIIEPYWKATDHKGPCFLLQGHSISIGELHMR
jgi:hypothetical protein